jgi:hypothetical protein
MIGVSDCHRMRGGSVRDCDCRLPGGGWLPCPPAARGVRRPRPPQQLAGEFCADCGGVGMVRTGTCLTCLDCGSANGGCS